MMTAPPPTPRGRREHGRLAGWFLRLCVVATVLLAATAFALKGLELYATAGEGRDGRDLLPALNELLVAAGFLFLFLWSWLSGRLRTPEAPKHRMLELQAELDSAETGDGG